MQRSFEVIPWTRTPLLLAPLLLMACDPPKTTERPTPPQETPVVAPEPVVATAPPPAEQPQQKPEEKPAQKPTAEPINDGWVGDVCAAPSDCTVDGAFCRADFPGGMCSLDCDGKFCADTEAPNTTATFCTVAGPANAAVCVPRCSFSAYPNTGCRAGYTCSTSKRFNDAAAEQDVCVPTSDGSAPITSCRANFARDGNTYSGWVPTDNTAPGTSPPVTCTIIDPMSITSPVGGMKVLYNQTSDSQMRARCELASAISRMVEIAKTFGIEELHHLGTYNCRVIAGTTTISQHGFANAIDIMGVKMKTGETYTIKTHWEKGKTTPTTAAGKLLYDFVHKLHEEHVFNIILTPEYNAAHADHFHMDLTPNSNVIKDEPVWILEEFDGVE